MTPRILQNFKGSRAVIIAPNRQAVEGLELTVTRLGLEVFYPEIREGRADLDLDGLRSDRDIVFLDSDVDFTIIFPDASENGFLQAPVIGLVGVEAPSRLRNLIQVGATEFLRKPVNGSAAYTAIFLGVNQFMIRNGLEAKLEESERRRRGRRWVTKAIVALMNDNGIDDDEAHARLRRESMKLRLTIEDYCQRLLQERSDTAEAPRKRKVLA